MVDCSVGQSAVVDCLFQAYGCMQRDGYPCRRQASAVVDCSVDQSAVVDCGFTWGIVV